MPIHGSHDDAWLQVSANGSRPCRRPKQAHKSGPWPMNFWAEAHEKHHFLRTAGRRAKSYSMELSPAADNVDLAELKRNPLARGLQNLIP